MKHIKFLFVLFLLGALGCQRISEEDSQKGEFVIHARTEGGEDTKTSLSGLGTDGMYHALWAAGDVITVYADGSTVPGDFTLTSGAGTDRATFSGATAGSSFIGFYPSSMIAAEGWQSNVLTINLPQEQAYAAGTFAPGTFPMIAVGSASNLTFKNLCAILKVSITGEEQVNSIEFKPADASKIVSGKATVQTNYGGGSPQLVMAAGGANTVTLNCGAVQLNATTPTDFYLVIPAGTYTGGFSLDIKTFHGTITKTTTQDITFERSQLRAVPAFECVGTGGDDPDNVPYNQIWYVPETGFAVIGVGDSFNTAIVSNVCENGKGVITFAGSVTSVGDEAFRAAHIKEIHLPDCVENIGNMAFQGTAITEFRTPESLSSLSSSAFRLCNSLNRFYGKWATADGRFIMLDGGVLAAQAPAAMPETLTLPANTVTVSDYMFMYQDGVKKLIVPEGVTTFGESVFAYSNSLETVTLPASLTSVGMSSFAYCPNLTKYDGSSSCVWDGGKLLVSGGFLISYVGSDTDYVIPEGVACLAYQSVVGRNNLHSITMPSTLGNLYTSWMADCPNVEFFYGPYTSDDNHCLVFGDFLVSATPVCPSDYTVPSGVERIFYEVFNRNSTIVNLTLPDEVYTAQGCFQYMPNLKTITISSGMQTMGNDPFYGDSALEGVYMRSSVPPSCAFNYSWGASNLVIYVPQGYETQYKQASGWSKYSSRIQGYDYSSGGGGSGGSGGGETPDYYISTDFSHDGDVTVMQTATVGNGINLVLMGDAYSDRQIADGTYLAAMNKMMDAFFSEEPYTTFQNLFNVYAVSVVSTTEGYDHAGQALSTYFDEGTHVGGDDSKCMEYAQKAIPSSQLNNSLIIVAMNRDYYAGTCYMYYPSAGDYGDGMSIAYFPTSSDESTFKGLVRHEAGGHGFAKLGDEYAYEQQGAIPQSEIDNTNQLVPYGWWKNVDFTGDPSAVKWAHFLSDERYQYDGLGCYEGACTYWTGAWRPTVNSIMRYNTDGYNAPSREAIWYRLHKLAYGTDWEYSYEDFVAYDAVNRKTSASAHRRNYVERPMPPLHPPVVVGKYWWEADDEVLPAPGANSPVPVQERPDGPVSFKDFR